ncbi:uncharacterized protein TRIADDRAFT_20649 [Trichoplax adhaerens]|uniref:Uncharacterized protein n=2 Tax=Trichoplax adhaerens TaxID=10228 RepID=B3RNV9_TRIAD|nr:hypothetical protein TRIADDRAFT_20649 [Trichoplax adhaerens]EDV27530.1 hypothetical protein TRIADDRAFT_20649 [Trichoplax adhaerens]|eukprot:XP_002109364.1 hypothetical protein TRIADDRAFT_20649 [Trichoplax adhaerens]
MPHSLLAIKQKCTGCNQLIQDKFLLKVADDLWHEDCLRCYKCTQPLSKSCYIKDHKLYCKEDYDKRFGRKCQGCNLGILPDEMVYRLHGSCYHINCLLCIVCSRQFKVGDKYYISDEGKPICKEDYDVAIMYFQLHHPNLKRPRTSITQQQLKMLNSVYRIKPRPSRITREMIATKVGLDLRVVQVWFQNKRAKDKRSITSAHSIITE